MPSGQGEIPLETPIFLFCRYLLPSKKGRATTICLHFPILPLPFDGKYFCFMSLKISEFAYAATF
jgi:hypothetical protein